MRRALWLSLLLPALGCGDPLVAAGVQGEPVYTHPRFGITLGLLPEGVERPRYGMFWITDGVRGAAEAAVEQRGTSRAASEVSGILHLFAHPDPALLARTPDGARYGIAYLRLYEDADGDGQLSPGESVIGNALNGLLYVPEALSAERSPIGRALPAGYHRVDFPVPCGVYGMDLPVCADSPPVGARCRSPGECPAGDCLSGLLGWPQGYCAGQGVTCRPPDAVPWENPRPDGGEDLRWLAACATDADCRSAEGYSCNLAVGGCMPQPEMRASVGQGHPRSTCLEYQLRDPGRPAPAEEVEGACANDADCAGQCPPGAVGCGCDLNPRGAACISTCQATDDCPKDDEVCDIVSGFCRAGPG